MEKEVIGMTIVFSIVLFSIFYTIIAFFTNLYKDKKYEKQYIKIFKNAQKEIDDFIKYLNSQDILFNTTAYTQLKERLLFTFDKEFEPVIMEDAKDTLERYKCAYDIIITIKKQLVQKVEEIKEKIAYNTTHWYNNEEKLPEFFVLESIFSGKKTYCHSTNLHFLGDTQDIIGHIFDHECEYGKLKTISPKDYKISPMNEKEFYDCYLINRINVMNFTFYNQKNEYEKGLIDEFNKNYNNE